MDTGFKKTAMGTAVGRLRSSWLVGCMDFVLTQCGGCDGDDIDEVCHISYRMYPFPVDRY